MMKRNKSFFAASVAVLVLGAVFTLLLSLAGTTLSACGRRVLSGISGLFVRDNTGMLEHLQAENEALRLKATQLEQEAKSNTALKAAPGCVSARLAGFSTGFPVTEFWIDKGSSHGVSVHSEVTYEGSLLGTVTKVEGKTACVTLTTSPGFSAAATVAETGETALCEATADLSVKGRLQLSYLSGRALPAVGQTVETLGLGDDLLPGLILGRVEAIAQENGRPTAVILPTYDVTALRVCTVVVKKE